MNFKAFSLSLATRNCGMVIIKIPMNAFTLISYSRQVYKSTGTRQPIRIDRKQQQTNCTHAKGLTGLAFFCFVCFHLEKTFYHKFNYIFML